MDRNEGSNPNRTIPDEFLHSPSPFLKSMLPSKDGIGHGSPKLPVENGHLTPTSLEVSRFSFQMSLPSEDGLKSVDVPRLAG